VQPRAEIFKHRRGRPFSKRLGTRRGVRHGPHLSAATGTIDEFLGNGGGKHAAEDTAALISKYNIPDLLVGTTDPAAAIANPLGALCALMDNPGDSGT
jgi:hypothetical protein